MTPSPVRVLSDDNVSQLLSLSALLPVVEAAFVKQGRGEVERPPRPHFPVGTGETGENPAGTALTMPAYLHGSDTYATKLAAVHGGNAERDLPTVNAQIALTDAETGLPLSYMAGTRITNARTGCIGGLSAKYLAAGDEPIRLGVVGAGTQARWQTRAVAAATNLDSVRIYSPSESREACAADLRDANELGGVDVQAVETPEAAVAEANVVVTATTSEEPVFPGSALDSGTLVVAVGAYTAEMRELDSETMERAARVFADVPEEAAETGDVSGAGLSASELTPLSDVFEGKSGRESNEEILVVASVGTAVLDAATAAHVYEAAEEEGAGREVGL
ncbi:ornithine cyclodeaminase family protein [Haloprofundus sp. MHR1]|uniref:ornithine cyclodeaminase family protein n=1 Tax=Haloprofundus sp. MHR1 TaxID=2572921 RepID=UPI0010BE550E|nr:ornithine cyclodeaminase family protein [Haloprofundus sp. MHR1]QCJ46735.1 ornithine cyclodeaminase family protein [Haloprofundus sp. MHR1]